MGAWLTLAVLIVAGSLLLLRPDIVAVSGFDPSELGIGLAGLALLIFVLSTVLGGAGRGRRAGRAALTLAALVLAAVAGYGYRNDLVALGTRMAGDWLPPSIVPTRAETEPVGERAVRIRRRPDGHFVARTSVNGLPLAMLIDTGASTIVLRPADAQRLGVDTERLRYSVPVQTANGTTYAAHVRLRSVAVGPIVLDNVEALVARPGALKESLLGMSFLNRLRSYEFAGEFLTLRG